MTEFYQRYLIIFVYIWKIKYCPDNYKPINYFPCFLLLNSNINKYQKDGQNGSVLYM